MVTGSSELLTDTCCTTPSGQHLKLPPLQDVVCPCNCQSCGISFRLHDAAHPSARLIDRSASRRLCADQDGGRGGQLRGAFPHRGAVGFVRRQQLHGGCPAPGGAPARRIGHAAVVPGARCAARCMEHPGPRSARAACWSGQTPCRATPAFQRRRHRLSPVKACCYHIYGVGSALNSLQGAALAKCHFAQQGCSSCCCWSEACWRLVLAVSC